MIESRKFLDGNKTVNVQHKCETEFPNIGSSQLALKLSSLEGYRVKEKGLRDKNALTLRVVWQTANARLHILVHSAVAKNSMQVYQKANL
jgi:hypothetical protein